MKKIGKILALSACALLFTLAAVACSSNKLPKPTGLKVSGTLLSWNYVDKAASYVVEVDSETFETTKMTYSLAEYVVPKDYAVRVKAIAEEGYVDSDWSDTFTYKVTAKKLDKPTELAISKATLTWKTVANATGYTIDVDGQTFNASLSTYSLSNILEPKTYSIKVKANGNGVSFVDSDWSDATPYTLSVSKGLEFTLNESEDGYLVSGGEADDIIIVIPEKHEDIPVVGVADNGFSSNKTVKGVSLPSTIKTLGASSFVASSSLASIRLNEGLEVIGDDSFFQCSSLVNVTLPSTLKSIGAKAFGSTAVRSIHIPDGVQIIANNVFAAARSLVSVTGGENVIGIGDYAFNLCDKLESIVIGNEVQIIGIRAFEDCKRLTSIAIPNSVLAIGAFAFMNCTGLKNLEIGNGLMLLGTQEDGSVAAPEGEVWDGCIELETITVAEGGSYYVGQGNCLINAYGELVLGAKNSVIPSGVVAIANSAFRNRKNLTSISIPDSVLAIGTGAFLNCEKLKTVEMGANVTEIHEDAFRGCLTLEDITIPSGIVDNLKSGIFQGCIGLKKITIPSNIKVIEEAVFRSCSSLNTIIIDVSLRTVQKDAFAGCGNLTTVFYTGVAAQWNTMAIDDSNNLLKTANRYFYSENEPSTSGNFWHYVDETPTIWG